MSHAHESTRPSSDLDRRPRSNSPHRNTRLRWIALCVVAALLLSSCERAPHTERQAARRDEA
ncbi:MAG TPA: hypothetical protein VER76_21180, partial [Pyrinomonadaceae bacterium]|nr:hypothetical protein [Pyrinomonadaceae bacterium]